MPFVKGKSGNPKGAPRKEESIRKCLRASMSETITIPGKNGEPDTTITKGQFLSQKLFQIAAQGDLNAIKLCIDNVDGQAKQQVEMSGPDGGPMENQITVKFVE